jgi:hypothetical protein
MGKTLEGLEARRSRLFKQLESIGDFRRGLISVNYRKCGKKNCQCARRGHPGHGPQYLWNATINGQSQAQNLRLGPEVEKVEKEIANYRLFVGLCEQLVQVSEKICRRRPTREVADEKELEELKKNLQRRLSRKPKKKWGV